MPLPAHLVEGFWDKVTRHLVQRRNLCEPSAQRAVARYREELARLPGDDLVYHRSPPDVAEAIAEGGYATSEADVA